MKPEAPSAPGSAGPFCPLALLELIELVRKRTLANRDCRGDESLRTNSPPITQLLRNTNAGEPPLPPAMCDCP